METKEWDISIIDNINEIKKECSEPNWDGYGATAILESVLEHAKNISFLISTVISINIPPPDIVPMTDGEVCLDWVNDYKSFSISVGEHDNLNYAGKIEINDTTHGVVQYRSLEDKAALEFLASLIERIYQ